MKIIHGLQAVVTTRLNGLLLPCFLAIILTFLSCKKSDPDPEPYVPLPYTILIPRYFPDKLNIPADNPMTVEGVALGRNLFYDGRLSGRTDPDSLMTCSTCHLPSRSFECGIDHPKFTGGRTFGLTGVYTPHYMMPLINLVWNKSGYLWNGKIYPENPVSGFRNLEDLVWSGIAAPHEMNGDTARVAALFQSIKGYPELFRKAFGTEKVSVKNMGRAIAQFVRTLISSDSRFDKFLAGELQLTASERRGYALFMTEQGGDCFHCHGGEGNPLFTTNLFYNNGKDSVFMDPADRFKITGDQADIGAYKAPTLRNIAFTAPYMHDGRFKTLDEVLTFYNTGLVWSPSISPLMHHIGTHGIRLTPAQLQDLKSFLLTLSDSSFLVNPAFSRPARLPDQ
ncbi:MAG: cytochrome-c peroxidase [Alphaproteobacteria bacterium]|nr:cytochrome-c peroxidase [Alphaproteobacteria bacterium]